MLAEDRARANLLEQLAGLERAATPGPWKWTLYGDDRMFLEAEGRDYRHVLKITWPELLRDADADFIAAARNALPALIAVAEAAQAVSDEAESALWDDGLPAFGQDELAAAVNRLRAALRGVVGEPADEGGGT